MIELERRQAARFRAAVRRCVVGRPRGLAPPVVLQQDKDGLTLSTVLEETVLSLCLPGAGGPTERLVVPMTTLAALEGPGGGVATFEETDGGALRCRWQERGESKDIGCEAVPADQQPPPPPPGARSALMRTCPAKMSVDGKTGLGLGAEIDCAVGAG